MRRSARRRLAWSRPPRPRYSRAGMVLWLLNAAWMGVGVVVAITDDRGWSDVAGYGGLTLAMLIASYRQWAGLRRQRI